MSVLSVLSNLSMILGVIFSILTPINNNKGQKGEVDCTGNSQSLDGKFQFHMLRYWK